MAYSITFLETMKIRTMLILYKQLSKKITLSAKSVDLDVNCCEFL